MQDNPNIQKIGYTEMYEWAKNPDLLNNGRFGLFVQFNKHEPEKIEPFIGDKELYCGITTAQALETSDDPAEWIGKYKTDNYGDYYVKQEFLAVGNKEYDQQNEFSFIRTFPYSVYKKIQSDEFDENEKYIPRTMRAEWIRVNLVGKCIVQDNGKCEPGKFCSPYAGTDATQAGIAVPSKSKLALRFLVLKRLSDNTILILNRPIGL